jgi:membrane protein EpsK
MDILIVKAIRAMKYVALVIALPIGLCCGLSSPLLKIWLGKSFADWSPLMWLIVGGHIFNIIVNPITGINRGLNKVRWPAIVTFIGGILNLVISVLLVRYTNMGLYGVAISVCFCVVAKHFIFLPMYTASILNKSKGYFFGPLVLGGGCCSVVGLFSLLISKLFLLDTIVALMIVGLLISIIYVVAVYMLLLDKEDRIFINSLFKTKLLNA